MEDLGASKEVHGAEGERRERRKELGGKEEPGHVRPCRAPSGLRKPSEAPSGEGPCSRVWLAGRRGLGVQGRGWEAPIRTWQLLVARSAEKQLGAGSRFEGASLLACGVQRKES